MDQKHMMEERENNYTLTLENVRESNLGEYTCSAVNKIGDGQAVVFLTGTKKKSMQYVYFKPPEVSVLIFSGQ